MSPKYLIGLCIILMVGVIGCRRRATTQFVTPVVPVASVTSPTISSQATSDGTEDSTVLSNSSLPTPTATSTLTNTLGEVGTLIRSILCDRGYFPGVDGLAWSPTDEYITFLEGGGGLALIKLSPSFDEVVSVEVVLDEVYQFAWSPDGKSIVFTRTIHDEQLNILHIATGEIEEFTFDTSGQIVHSPVWSPSGNQIAFVWADYGIMLLNPTNQQFESVTDEQNKYIDPNWSYDDELLTYVSVGNSIEDSNILYVVNGDTYDLVQVVGDGQRCYGFPVWSPTRNQLAFASMDDKNAEVFVHDLDTNSLVNISQDEGHNISFSWSPTGDRIAFVSGRGTSYYEETFELFVVDRDGTNKVQLTDTRFVHEVEVVWSPDGEHLAVWASSQQFGQHHIEIIRLEDNQRWRLLSTFLE